MPMVITRGAASAKGFGWSSGVKPVTGQQAYTTAGTYSWVVPAGVTKVSVVVVSGGGNGGNGGCCGGGGGGGGGLGYTNNFTVIPGNSLSIQVGTAAQQSYFNTAAGLNVYAGQSGSGACGGLPGAIPSGPGIVGYRGGYGGCSVGAQTYSGGGAGAAGYSANGASGGLYCNGSGCNASGGGGGGGGGGYYTPGVSGGGGGGVGILGAGSNGIGGTTHLGGTGGSGGCNGAPGPSNWVAGAGGKYGGGGGGSTTYGGGSPGAGGSGAVRIIWPGCARSFPSTRTANE